MFWFVKRAAACSGPDGAGHTEKGGDVRGYPTQIRRFLPMLGLEVSGT